MHPSHIIFNKKTMRRYIFLPFLNSCMQKYSLILNLDRLKWATKICNGGFGFWHAFYFSSWLIINTRTKWVTSLDHLCGPIFSLIPSIHFLHLFLLFNVWNWNYHPFVFVGFGFGVYPYYQNWMLERDTIWWQHKWELSQQGLLVFHLPLKKCEIYISSQQTNKVWDKLN